MSSQLSIKKSWIICFVFLKTTWKKNFKTNLSSFIHTYRCMYVCMHWYVQKTKNNCMLGLTLWCHKMKVCRIVCWVTWENTSACEHISTFQIIVGNLPPRYDDCCWFYTTNIKFLSGLIMYSILLVVFFSVFILTGRQAGFPTEKKGHHV